MKTITTAKVLLVDADGSVLVLRRSSIHPDLAGYPDLPGGVVEPGEEPGAAVAREILEETGLDLAAADLQLLYAETGTYKGQSRVRLLYAAKLSAKEPAITISGEHDNAEWATTDRVKTIKAELLPQYRHGITYIHKHGLLEG